jgi:membrane-bound serine protease (ClpP class)
MTAAIAAFFVFVVRALVRAHRRPVATGIEALVGREGTAVSDLAPEGTVRVDSENWHAVAEGGGIAAGEPIRIIGVEGVTLRVVRPSAITGADPALRRTG